MASIVVLSKSLEGPLWKCLVDVGGDVEVFRVRNDADLDAQALAYLDAKARVITLGSREVVAPVVRPPDPPTQDDLDRAAFSVLVREYRNLSAEVAAKVGKTTQADVDAKVAQIKAAYKDEYAPMLVGVF